MTLESLGSLGSAVEVTYYRHPTKSGRYRAHVKLLLQGARKPIRFRVWATTTDEVVDQVYETIRLYEWWAKQGFSPGPEDD